MTPIVKRLGAQISAVLVMNAPAGQMLIRLRRVPAASALEAFVEAVRGAHADAPTACEGWTAHDLLAHMTAGTAELADLALLAVDGKTRATRNFAEREAPYRAMAHPRLKRRFVVEGIRLATALQRLDRQGLSIEFTGTSLSARQIEAHAASELVLHRYDLVGLDDRTLALLADRALVTHAHEVVARMDDGVLPAPSERSGGSLADLVLAVWGR